MALPGIQLQRTENRIQIEPVYQCPQQHHSQWPKAGNNPSDVLGGWSTAVLATLWEKDGQQHNQEYEQATAHGQPQVDPAPEVLPALLLGQGLGCLAEGRALWTPPDIELELVVSPEPWTNTFQPHPGKA